jgi:hypothetical protein
MFNGYPKQLVKRIQAVLTPDLSIRPSLKKLPTPFWGCCYPATEALYYLWGRERSFLPHRVRWPGCPNGHWYLMNANGLVVDPTAEQFITEKVPYEKGKCFHYRSAESKRCQILMARLLWSIAVKKGTISISADLENGETLFRIYTRRSHASELIVETKLSKPMKSGYTRSLNSLET